MKLNGNSRALFTVYLAAVCCIQVKYIRIFTYVCGAFKNNLISIDPSEGLVGCN